MVSAAARSFRAVRSGHRELAALYRCVLELAAQRSEEKGGSGWFLECQSLSASILGQPAAGLSRHRAPTLVVFVGGAQVG